MRKSTCTRALAMALVALLACGMFAVGASADMPKLSGTITISLGMGQGLPVWEALVAAYNQYQPDVKVVLDDKDGATYTDWLSNQLAADDLQSDIVTNNTVAKYIQAGNFVDFNEYINDPNPYNGDIPWVDGLDPAVLRPNGPNDGVYCLNVDSVQVLWFYNKAIFEQVGVTPPTNWDELIDVCEKIKAAGFVPIAISGNANSFWEMTMGWLFRVYADQYWRSVEPEVVSQPDDYNYDPDKNDEWEFNIDDIQNDTSNMVMFNPLRGYKLLEEGKIGPDSDKYRDMYANFAKVFPKYAEDGFFGATYETVDALFIQGQAAMRVDGAWFAAGFDNTMKDAPTKFELGYFWSPPMTGDQVAVPYTRSLGGPNGFLGVVNHSKEQNDLVMDFMKFYASPQGQEVRYGKMAEINTNPAGPSLVKNVKMPDKWASIFDGMGYNGECDNNPISGIFNRGLSDEQESVRAWTENAQNFFNGKMTLDEYSKAMQQVMLDALPRVIKNNNWREDCLEDPSKDPIIAK